jgi:two-component system response regulator (stage 0 sporulation protein F)
MARPLVEGTMLRATIPEPRDTAPAREDADPYVLVVDDEAVVRDFLERCLEGSGYHVMKAGSAAEALEMMVERPAAIVLCDIRMPGQDGLWLASRLRAHWPSTQIVMITALDDLETVRHSRDLGAVDYITKPVTQELLLQVVRRTLTDPDHRQPNHGQPSTEEARSPAEALPGLDELNVEAEYTLECPVRCPACGERLTTVKAVRLIRGHVNFTSTLPRRGRVIACPLCLAIVPAELSNF